MIAVPVKGDFLHGVEPMVAPEMEDCIVVSGNSRVK